MEPRSDDRDESDHTHAKSFLGWGGVFIDSEGIGHPIPEPEALASAIPQWVDIPGHIEDAVSIYIDAMSRPEVAIRKAAMTAIGAIVVRYRRLPQESRARQTVTEALHDSSVEVSAAAATTSDIIRNILG